jgi:hypothetical protein
VDGPRSDSQRDALFCLAILDSQSDEMFVIERSRDRFNCIKRMLEAPGAFGGPEGLHAAAVRGETAAVARLRHRNVAAVPCDAASDRVDG